MKNTFLKLLSALLALCMISAAFTTVLTSTLLPAYAEETEDEEGEKEENTSSEFQATDLEKIPYASELDKLLTMSKKTPVLDGKGQPVLDQHGNPTYTYAPWIVNGDYELYVQEKTGEVAVKNTKTGQVIFSNPYSLKANVESSSTLKPMFAQLSIKYQTIKDGKTSTMNSYEDSAARDQLTVSYIKNGICVEYTVGREDERRLVPFWMEKYRFEKLLLSQMPVGELAYSKMNVYYMEVDMNKKDMTSTYIAELENQYACLAKWDGSSASKTFVSEDYDSSLEAEYAERRAKGELAVPYSGRMSIRVLAEKTTTNYEKNKIEEYIRSYSPEYNYETLAYDHELTGFVGKRATLPIFKMALEYRLDKDGFSVRLPANSITFDEDNFRLLSIDVLPYMGAGSSDNTGYTFVPDGSGTIIRFEDVKGVAVGFNTGTLYGPDNAYHTLPTEYTGQAEKMRYPVFGVVEDVEKVFDLNEDGSLTEVCPHRFVVKTVSPDCTTGKDGYDYEYCAVCGATGKVTKKVAWKHTFTGQPTITQEATCHQYKITTQTCEVCLKAYNEQKAILKSEGKTDAEIETLIGHLKTVVTVDVAGGYADHKYEQYIVADKENHICYEIGICQTKYPQVDENGNPVLDADGNQVMLVCGHESEKIVTEHTYEEEDRIVCRNGRCYRTNTCSECGYVMEEDIEHTFTAEAVVVHSRNEHRCYELRICDKCGYQEKTDIDHDFGNARFSQEDGLCVITETCNDCGFVSVTKKPHVMSGTAVERHDTVNHRCYREYKCGTCGINVTVEEDHTIVDGTCSKCGYTVPKVNGHTLEEAYVSVRGKCYRTFKCSDEGCNYELTSARVEVAHRYSDKRYVPATCTERGFTAYVCLNCGHYADITVVEDEEADPTGHDYQWTTDKKVSCVEDYRSEHKCTKCGDVVATKVVPAEGHDYEVICIISETETEKGIYKHVCRICGHEHYETRPVKVPEPVVPDEGDDKDDENKDEEGKDEEPKQVTVSVTHGYVAVITAGSSLASLVSSHGGPLHKYNYVYMTVNPRPQDSYNLRDSISTGADASWTVVSERKYNGSYSLKYFMLQTVSEDAPEGISYANSAYKATYAGMAAAYRNYLKSTGILEDIENKNDSIPLYLEAFGAITVDTTFMTIPTTEKKPLTTFEDLKGIVEELRAVKNENGDTIYSITNVNLKLTGFANNGMNYNVPYKVKFEKVVGGNDGFKDFVSFAKENKIGVYPDFDFAYLKHNQMFDGYSDSKHAVKTIDDRYIVKKDYNSTLQIFTNTGLLAISASVYDYFYTEFNKNYSKFDNMGISAGSLGTDLNSDFDKDEPYNREDSREFTERILKKMKEDYGSVMVDGGNAYTLGYVDHILNMSLSGSNYLRTSESVPFMSMVLHGSINYAGTVTNMASSMDQEILHIIENGASPYFLIACENTRYLKEISSLSKYYSLDYSTWKSDMIEVYITLNEALKDVQYAEFVDHGFIIGERLPDEDELSNDYKTAKAAIDKAISDYNAAVDRLARAKALIERKTVTEPNVYRKEIEAILAKYNFASADQSTMEALSVKLSEEDEKAVAELTEKIAECLAVGENSVLIENVSSAEISLRNTNTALEKCLTQYAYLFDVSEEDRLNAEAYNKGSYHGAVYQDNGGKYVVACKGKLDAEGKELVSAYTVKDNSIVKVAYDNGVEFYLNYNYFDVIVEIDGENVVIGAYDFYKNV